MKNIVIVFSQDKYCEFSNCTVGAASLKISVECLLYFLHDFAMLHFAMFFNQIFKLQLLTQFLTDLPKIWTVYLPICILYV